MDRAAVIEEMEQARSSFRQLLTDAAQPACGDAPMAPVGPTGSCCSTCSSAT